MRTMTTEKPSIRSPEQLGEFITIFSLSKQCSMFVNGNIEGLALPSHVSLVLLVRDSMNKNYSFFIEILL